MGSSVGHDLLQMGTGPLFRRLGLELLGLGLLDLRNRGPQSTNPLPGPNERILKIGRYLAKLRATYSGGFFGLERPVSGLRHFSDKWPQRRCNIIGLIYGLYFYEWPHCGVLFCVSFEFLPQAVNCGRFCF